MNAVDNHIIKDVAILLRKSRGEDIDLEKQRADLVELCEKNNWRYVEYAEVVSSQAFEDRSKLMAMLDDIQEGLFDAVVVIDKDRLSREGVGQATINQILAENECLIVTPSKIYDLSNDTDMMVSEFEDLMARHEFRIIRKRFKRGKIRGAKLGHWTNGTPPIPYCYNAEDKSLKVEEDKLEVYRYMVDEFLKGNSPYNIAWELNKLKIPSPRGNLWRDVTVRRILMDETHLGKIISNKTTGWKKDKHGKRVFKNNAPEKWIVVENCHKAVKTKDEHIKIEAELTKRRRPHYAKRGTFPLTGLVKCKKCGRSMTFNRSENGAPVIKKCGYLLDDNLTKCGNNGYSTKIIIDEIERQLYLFKEDIQNQISRSNGNKKVLNSIQREVDKRNNRLNELEEELEQITALAIAKFFSIEESIQRKEKIKKEIKKIETELNLINKENNKDKEVDNMERLKTIEQVIEIINNPDASGETLNRIYKSIIHSIDWDKPDNDHLTVCINFL